MGPAGVYISSGQGYVLEEASRACAVAAQAGVSAVTAQAGAGVSAATAQAGAGESGAHRHAQNCKEE